MRPPPVAACSELLGAVTENIKSEYRKTTAKVACTFIKCVLSKSCVSLLPHLASNGAHAGEVTRVVLYLAPGHVLKNHHYPALAAAAHLDTQPRISAQLLTRGSLHENKKLIK